MYVYFNLPANEIICNGKQITFQAPYDCSSIDKITLIASNGTSETERKNFVLCDSLGNSLVGKTGYFTANSYVSVLLDKDNGKAYLQTFAKSIQDSTSAGTLSSSRTGLCTERDIYFGLPTINGSHSYTSSTNIYAPTSVGTKGQVLVSNGSGAPSWGSAAGISDISRVELPLSAVSCGANDTYSSSWNISPGSAKKYILLDKGSTNTVHANTVTLNSTTNPTSITINYSNLTNGTQYPEFKPVFLKIT